MMIFVVLYINFRHTSVYTV